MAEHVVENARTEAEAVIAEAEAITNSAAEVLDTPEIPLVPELSAEELARREMNRREFLMYTWAGALVVVSGVTGFAMFEFLYPRFKAGQFGGKFNKTTTDFGTAADAPRGDTDGRFWMVTTQDGSPKAIYMVCTHLGCLYKWSDTNHRFECPCHGSKFSHDGDYIEGPAPRSLDYFKVTVQNDTVVVDTGNKVKGGAAVDSPAKGAPIGTV